jgi:hypothetical protein
MVPVALNYACMMCWPWASGIFNASLDLVASRDAIYAEGCRRRERGEMPPLAAQGRELHGELPAYPKPPISDGVGRPLVDVVASIPGVSLPSIDSLAFALFATDPRIVADVEAHADLTLTVDRLTEVKSPIARHHAFIRAWEANRLGVRVECEKRAAAMRRLM